MTESKVALIVGGGSGMAGLAGSGTVAGDVHVAAQGAIAGYGGTPTAPQAATLTITSKTKMLNVRARITQPASAGNGQCR